MVSYVVAIYDVREYLSECIESVIQNEDDIEVLLIDDGSTDGSSEVCDQYALKDNRIRVIHQQNQGVSVARNTGLEQAKGEWICYIDGDDKINIDLNSAVCRVLDNSADIVMFQYTMDEEKAYGQYFDIHRISVLDRKKIVELRAGILNSDMKEVTYYKKNNYNYHAPWGKFYRRDFLIKNNLRFVSGVKKGQDMLFNFDVYKYANEIQLVPFVGYYYRTREDSIGHKYNCNIAQINMRLVKEFKKRITIEDSKRLIENYYLMVVRQFVFCMLLDCCHPLNEKSYRIRKKEYLHYRNINIFSRGFKNAKLRQLRFQVRIFALMAKYKCFMAMCLISKIKTLMGK